MLSVDYKFFATMSDKHGGTESAGGDFLQCSQLVPIRASIQHLVNSDMDYQSHELATLRLPEAALANCAQHSEMGACAASEAALHTISQVFTGITDGLQAASEVEEKLVESIRQQQAQNDALRAQLRE